MGGTDAQKPALSVGVPCIFRTAGTRVGGWQWTCASAAGEGAGKKAAQATSRRPGREALTSWLGSSLFVSPGPELMVIEVDTDFESVLKPTNYHLLPQHLVWDRERAAPRAKRDSTFSVVGFLEG